MNNVLSSFGINSQTRLCKNSHFYFSQDDYGAINKKIKNKILITISEI